jgi:Cdc6-like AAA superfamily ATPase
MSASMDKIRGYTSVMIDPDAEWPTQDDIDKHRLVRDDGLITSVNELMSLYRRCVIMGAEGRGKTVLARFVAREKHKEHR